MARRNKKVLKLRAYRDKLLSRMTVLERDIRLYKEMFREIRHSIANDKDSTLRAYAIATNGLDGKISEKYVNIEFLEKNEIIAELTLVYRMLSIEREYTNSINIALRTQDLLRIAALAADHRLEAAAHDKMLSTWSKDHGFTRLLRG